MASVSNDVDSGGSEQCARPNLPTGASGYDVSDGPSIFLRQPALGTKNEAVSKRSTDGWGAVR